MTEPTQEQVERERERAHAVLRGTTCDHQHWEACDAVATALARRALAARDEAIEGAITLVARYADLNGLFTADLCEDIRALRGAR